MSFERHVTNGEGDWLAAYKLTNAERLNSEPEFAAWLDGEYVPIAGGWQY